MGKKRNGKKKKNSFKSLNPPRPPTPQSSDRIPAENSDPQVVKYCDRALVLLGQGKHPSALKLMKRLLARHPNSAQVHHTQAFLLGQLSINITDDSIRLQRLQNAAFHAKEALSLTSTNAIDLVVSYNSILLMLAKDQKDCIIIIENCQRALLQKPMIFLPQAGSDECVKEASIIRTKVELKKLVEHAKMATLDMYIPSQDDRDSFHVNMNLITNQDDVEWDGHLHRIKIMMARLHQIGRRIVTTRDLHITLLDNVERDEERNLACRMESARKLDKTPKVLEVLDVWRRKSDQEKRRFVKIRVDDIVEYYSNKKGLRKELLMEVLDLKRKRGNWTVWKCYSCQMRFSEQETWDNHMACVHTGLWKTWVEEKVRRSLIDPRWARKIVTGVWKPVDVDEMIKTVAQHPEFQVVGDDTGGSVFQENWFRDEENWVYCDDSERKNLLDKIYVLLTLFSSQMFIVRWVMQFAVDILRIVALGLGDFFFHILERTPSSICFLPVEQLKLVVEMLQVLSTDSPAEVVQLDRHDPEILGCSSEPSCLLLDEQMLRIKLASEVDGLASEGYFNSFILWLFKGSNIVECLHMWEDLKAMKQQHAKHCLDLLQYAYEEIGHLQMVKLQRLSYMDSISDIQHKCDEERKRRVEVPGHDPQAFASLLLDRCNKFNKLMVCKYCFEPKMIMAGVLKSFEYICRRKFGSEKNFLDQDVVRLSNLKCDEDELPREELMARADVCLETAVEEQKVNFTCDVFRYDILIAKLTIHTEMMERYMVFLSSLDYHPIVLHLWKSYIKQLLLDVTSEEAREKAKAAKRVSSTNKIRTSSGYRLRARERRSKHKKSQDEGIKAMD